MSEQRPNEKGHRWFAAFYDLLMQGAERRLLGRLRTLAVGEASGRVLEIGVGTGTNLPHYQAAQELVATDPDPFMLSKAQRRAEGMGIPVELHRSPAEALPFPDASFDTVVSTLVLCTAKDVPKSLAEAKRVLKPDGTLRFIEHVRGEGLLGRVQDVVTPAWRWFGAGCHPNRRTAEALVAAGFDLVELHRHPFFITPMVFGTARPRT